MEKKTVKTQAGEIKIFEELKFPQLRRKRSAMSVVCKREGKAVARFPSVDAAAEYIAPRAKFSPKYVRNSIYRALKSGEMFPPFSDYFWEVEESAFRGTLVTYEPEDLKRGSPFLNEEERLKAAEPKKPLEGK